VRALVFLLVGCNAPIDYPSPRLAGFGLHRAPLYVVSDLMPAHDQPILIAHPRLGQPAIRKPGEPFDVGWLGADLLPQATLDGDELALRDIACKEMICHATAIAPSTLGLHRLCVGADCSDSAVAVVSEYHDPARILQLSDAHLGDSSAGEWAAVIDAVNRESADVVVFTGDAADTGLDWQLEQFWSEFSRLNKPAFMVTGNHDMDNGGLDRYLLQIGPELDWSARYGALKFIGFSDGQDLDDGDHVGTLSESSGPDETQTAWLITQLDDTPAVVLFHHPIYNALFATVGPDRDELLRMVTRDSVREVLVGHVHITQVYDRDGESRGLSTDAEVVDWSRWPLHYTCARSTINGDGYALHTVGSDHVEYRWVSLDR
jgi:predicted phosphodiesterase